MLPIGDENPHPPGFKPKLTYAFIAVNVIIFFFEVAVTGEFFEFTNPNAAKLFYEWGAVPACIVGESYISAGPYTIPCPDMPYLTLLSSTFLHGGLMHLGGNMLFLWIFGDNIEAKFGRAKFFVIYLGWGIGAGLVHVLGDPSSPIPAVGASGAISGVLGAYLVIFPHAKVKTFLMLGITIFHRGLWCCRRRSCISCTHWRIRLGTSSWIYLQKISWFSVYLWNTLWL